MCNCAKEAYELINREHGNAEIEMEGMFYRPRFADDSLIPTDQFMVCCYSYRKRNKNGDYYEPTKVIFFIPIVLSAEKNMILEYKNRKRINERIDYIDMFL